MFIILGFILRFLHALIGGLVITF